METSVSTMAGESIDSDTGSGDTWSTDVKGTSFSSCSPSITQIPPPHARRISAARKASFGS